MKKIGIILLLAVLVGAVMGREWSEPVELTRSRRQYLDTEFNVALGGNGNIHLLYIVQQYYANEEAANRVMYSVYEPDGRHMRTIVPMGEERRSGTGRLITDEQDNAYIMCLAKVDEETTRHWYTCINNNGEYAIEPIIIDGLPLGSVFDFFLCSDGTFIFTTLRLEYEGDTPFYTVFYARFNSDGEIIGEPHNLYTDHNSEENFHYLKASLDEEDNLHLVWRSATVNNRTNRVAYACVNADDEIITELTYVPALDNQNHTGCNRLIARHLDEVYLLMIDPETYPYNDYVQRMNSDCETMWITTVLEQEYSRRLIDISLDGEIISVIGAYAPNPESSRTLQYFYSSIDISGDFADPLDLIGEVHHSDVGSDPYVIRKDDTIYWFYKHNINPPIESGIMMVRTIVEDDVQTPELKPIEEFTLSAYPNPFNSSLILQIPQNITNNFNILLYDASGRLVIKQPLYSAHGGSRSITIPSLERLPNGSYVLTIMNEDKQAIGAFAPVIVNKIK